MKRYLMQNLIQWQNKPNRKPLIVRGARQIGKSTLIETFGEEYFEHCLTLNFDLDTRFAGCFESLEPEKILSAISLLQKTTVLPGKTLLFLDEVQECPNAIKALRYFKEKMPELHVIAAGSLLELTLSQANFRMPVGRVELMKMYPVSFEEYLLAENPQAHALIQKASLKDPINSAIHDYLLEQLKLYLLMGGMPEATEHYLNHKNLREVSHIQEAILNTYRHDFGKYETKAKIIYLRECFDKLPYKIGEQIKYSKINPDVRAYELKEALSTLELALIAHRIQCTTATGLPLHATTNDKKFKMNFLDVGLVKSLSGITPEILLKKDNLLLDRGALTEQFVGQELLAYSDPETTKKLYYWSRDGSATAEVDYIEVIDGEIIPIEVKSGKIGRLRSLKQLMSEQPIPLGVRISAQPLHHEQNILSIPLYMVGQLKRLVSDTLKT